MHYESGVGHLGGNLSALDLLLVLFHEVLGPNDQFILSKGHAAGALYVTLWSRGRLTDTDLTQFHKDGTRLSGHPPAAGIDDILFATGSLGHGAALAAGLALAKKLTGRPGRVYCLTSDGEWNEGASWEALIFARQQNLDNLVVIVDLNGLQGFGTTREVADLEPLVDKFRAFQVSAAEVDGHDQAALSDALASNEGGPRLIVARTRKGCGVSFMEGRLEWHYLPLSTAQYQQAARGSGGGMRHAFCQALVAEAGRPEFVLLTGDLGFMALEPVRAALGKRFINGGVAEQNLVSVAAGLARAGLRPWVYSIAPFLYARPYEQIRNDICLHGLPVVLVGNGGGYGYGVMGATHHAIEDYGALLCLPNLRAYVPAFDPDVTEVVRRLCSTDHPAYLRLGVSELPPGFHLPGVLKVAEAAGRRRRRWPSSGHWSAASWTRCGHSPTVSDRACG